MGFEAWASLITVVLVMVAMLSNRIAMDVGMAGGLFLLLLLGVSSVEDAFRGVAHPAVLMIGSLFVVAAGLRETGAIQVFAERFLGRPTNVSGAQLRLMASVALLSGFMNNTPVVAMYLSIVDGWARKIRISPSKLFIPLSFSAILGGRLTLIGSSSNIVAMGLYLQYLDENSALPAGVNEISSMKQFWGPGAVGLPITIVGIAFILVFSRWLLPIRKPALEVGPDARKYTVQMEVRPDSPIVNKSIEEAGLRHLPGLFLIEIDRLGELIPAPPPYTLLRAGDVLSLAGILESVVDLRRIRGLVPATDQISKVRAEYSQRILVEAVVSHNSPLNRRTVRQSWFRTIYNAAVIAVHRNGEQIKTKVGDIVLKAGDTLLLETHRGFVEAHHNSPDFFLVSGVQGSTPIRHERAWVAVALFGIFVVCLGFTNVEPVVAAFGCALGMVLTGCLSRAEAHRSVDWQVLVIIACALGIGGALQQTGAAAYLATRILDFFIGSGFGPHGMLFVIFMLCAVLAQVITNNGSAAVMFPIAMVTARGLGVSAEPFLFSLMMGAGSSFATPLSYQTNLMVYGPGGYRFSDFVYLGIPLTLLMGFVTTLACPFAFPFHP